ncbi:MAG: EAL domain-containing protein, partial [Gammaproteobacteria bacterium]
MSSYGYLKQLPVDWIKIDGMFIRDILNDEVNMIFVRNIIELAKAMGKKTVAEYVENQAILTKVKELGVSYAQGYELGRPEVLFSES